MQAGKRGQDAPEVVWLDAAGKEADEKQVKALIASLSNVMCQKYMDGRKKEDLGNPMYTIQLGGAQAYFLSIFASPDEKSKNYPG